MSDVHLRRDGSWERCRLGADGCTRKHHLRDTTVEAAQALPAELLWPLFEATNPPTKIEHGNKTWLDSRDLLHRDYDLPAIINTDGTLMWYFHGNEHREGDRPAVVTPRQRRWYQHGLLHRENDLPAVIINDGDTEWYRRGKLHRENDLPAVVGPDGYQAWYYKDKLHRGRRKPAVINTDGSFEFWTYGEMVREQKVTP